MMVSRCFILIIILTISSCRQFRQLSDVFVAPSPRELYGRNFEKGHFIYNSWVKSFDSALGDSLQIALPYFEVGSFLAQDFPVYGYSTFLSRGEKMVVSITTIPDSVPVFIDIYKLEPVDSLRRVSLFSDKRFAGHPAELSVEETGIYRVLLQPELRREADFQIEIYALPTLAFPVAGVPDKAIQSFWGATRSAGARLHEGLDIFAPRLTPVLAVADGRVSYAGERGLGGKQVWLREGFLKKSFYYAHLDSIIVSQAQKVTVGDTLGLVGNTGNAKTTAPHLHFGIYTGNGAIDPLPFIRRNKRERVDLKAPSYRGVVVSPKANVRLSPSTRSDKVATITYRDTVVILGKTINWYHAELSDKMQGYIHQTLIQEVDQGHADDISSN
jgi:hypothetical protein